jgi:hypothetical protein
MPDRFDPYHRFLGIPPRLQPPNHYRLLGLEPFEQDHDVIAGAADRQMTHVRNHEGGPHDAEARKLLSELAAARVCLLSVERKAAYDAALRKHLANIAARKATPPPVAAATPLNPAKHDDEEPLLVTDPPKKRDSASSLSIGSSKSTSAIARDRSAPSAIARCSTAPRPAVPPAPRLPAQPYSPIDSLVHDPHTHAPPYLDEYRRRFFETLIKVVLFVFVLVVLLLLFNAFALPWLRNSPAADEPSAEQPSPSQSIPIDDDPAPQCAPPNDEPTEEPENSTAIEIPAENERKPESQRNNTSIYKTIRYAIEHRGVRRTRSIGNDSGGAFEALNGEGGILVAIKLTAVKFGRNGESRAVASLQPEFVTSRGYAKGQVYGTPQETGLRFLAKAGYAVGAIKINSTPAGAGTKSRIVGIRVTFMRIDGQRLNPKDSYTSSTFPLDYSVPRGAPELGGNGNLVVGLSGSASDEGLHSLGLLTVNSIPLPPGHANLPIGNASENANQEIGVPRIDYFIGPNDPDEQSPVNEGTTQRSKPADER